MNYDLILADGSTVPVSMAGVGQQGDLWIHVQERSVSECALIFTDPQKTQTMQVSWDDTMTDTFEGFTELFYLSTCEDFVKVGLGKGVADA